MVALQFPVPFGALEPLAPVLPYAVLVLVVANLLTRLLANRRHVRQAREGGAEAVSRYAPHWATSVLLVVSSFLFILVVDYHGGMVLSVLVLGTFLADFFEFEARKVEARNDMEIERPMSAVVGSLVVLLYAAFQSLFFVVAPYWNAVV